MFNFSSSLDFSLDVDGRLSLKKSQYALILEISVMWTTQLIVGMAQRVKALVI